MSAFGTYLYTYASLCLSALVLCSGIFLISCLAVRKRSGVSPKRQALWFVTLWYLISLSMILFTTGHSGENDVNLYPLRSIYSAVADTGVSLSQLIVPTSGLFVPFGFLLMLVIRRRPLQYFIPLFSLVYALALEGLHLLFGYGAFDIDRPILGMLGALFGCGLCAMIFPSRCGGRRNVWHYVETAVPVALTAALLEKEKIGFDELVQIMGVMPANKQHWPKDAQAPQQQEEQSAADGKQENQPQAHEADGE